MKLLQYFYLFIFIFPFALTAQIKGTVEATGAYSFNLDTPGINFRNYYFLSEKLHLGIEYTHFFDNTEHFLDEKVVTSADVFDLNSNYFVELTPHFLFYTVLGLDYSREKEEIQLMDENEIQRDDAFGYNVGGGFEVPFNHHWAVLAEYTHTFSDLKDNIFFVGLVYEWEIKGKKHHQHSAD